MTTIKLSEFGRKRAATSKGKSEKELEAGHRLEQVAERLRASLGLGWGPSAREALKSIHAWRIKEEPVRWVCADLSIQAQAARALLGFAECVAAYFSFVERDQAWRQKLQIILVEAAAALASLLESPSSAVRNKAAIASEVLTSSVGNHLEKGPSIHLLPPLSALLDDADDTTVSSAGKTMAHLLHKFRVRDKLWNGAQGPYLKSPETLMWQALTSIDPLTRIERQLERKGTQESVARGEAGPKVAALLEVLEGLLTRWSAARKRVHGDWKWCHLVAEFCNDTEQEVAKSAFRCLASMVVECAAASHLAHKTPALWCSLSVWLKVEQSSSVKEAALHLLSLLPSAPKFGLILQAREWSDLTTCCVRALAAIPDESASQEAVLTSHLAMQHSLRTTALKAICALLRWPGKHHEEFLRNGLLAALSGILRGRAASEGKEGKQNPKLRLLAWQAMAWLATFMGSVHMKLASKEVGETSRNVSTSLAQMEKATALLCGAFCRVFHRRAALVSELQPSKHLPSDPVSALEEGLVPPGFEPSPQEAVEISRAMFAFATSQHEKLRTGSRASLEVALRPHGGGWVSSLVRQVSATEGGKRMPADVATHVALLTAVGVLFCIPACLGELLSADVGWVLVRIVNYQAALVKSEDDNFGLGETNDISFKQNVGIPVNEQISEKYSLPQVANDNGDEYFFRPIEDWEGKDPVLFAALHALTEFFHGQKLIGELRGNFQRTGEGNTVQNKQRGFDQVTTANGLSFGLSPHVQMNLVWEAEDALSQLVREPFPPGVRWNAVKARACLGIFGFPSAVGESMHSAFDNPSRADVAFLFSTGQRLHAHFAILASRSPGLISAFSSKSSEAAPFRKERVAGHISQSSNPEGNHNGPFEAHVSARVTYDAFRSLLEFVYVGVTTIPANRAAEVSILARKCALQPLAALLQGQPLEWGCPSAPCDLSACASSAGWPYRDAILHTDQGEGEGAAYSEHVQECAKSGPHLHVHRMVLEARCEYLAALLRSGMRDSVTGLLLVPEVSLLALTGLVHLLYSGRLSFNNINQPCSPPPTTPESSPSEEALLEAALQLAHLGERWMMADLQEASWKFVLERLEFGNALFVLRESAVWEQWPLVEAAVEQIVPFYVELREQGELDCLSNDLREAVRVAHVKLLTM